MNEVYKVSDLIPMEELIELLKDPSVRQKAMEAGWNIPELEKFVEKGDHPIAKKGEKPVTPKQCAIIALAEYEYWRSQERTDLNIAGMAAAANVYAAIVFGQFAPWHPGYPKEEKKG